MAVTKRMKINITIHILACFAFRNSSAPIGPKKHQAITNPESLIEPKLHCMNAEIHVVLFNKKSNNKILDDTGLSAGIEVAGKYELLLK